MFAKSKVCIDIKWKYIFYFKKNCHKAHYWNTNLVLTSMVRAKEILRLSQNGKIDESEII